ncbi:MAG: hypothetical protein AAFQ02_07120 [Bacteroidota bacterium]
MTHRYIDLSSVPRYPSIGLHTSISTAEEVLVRKMVLEDDSFPIDLVNGALQRVNNQNGLVNRSIEKSGIGENYT